MALIKAADIPSLSLLYRLRKLSPAAPGTELPPTHLGPKTDTPLPAPSKSFNDRVGLLRGDITSLVVDAIVNAANRSLLGGGGVDGAIHRVAGPELYDECQQLGGCKTGSAKITGGYSLPSRHVIHAVGPIYNHLSPDDSERLLTGCYTRSLELAVEHGCKTIAFSAISTGVYGYPSREAAPAALGAIRKFLAGPDGAKLDKVIIVTFEMKDQDAYKEYIPLYFPPSHQSTKNTASPEKFNGTKQTEAELDAEAQAVANELPSAPTSEPSSSRSPDEPGHIDKKQKQSTD
ncbi:uncharacterized protein C8A04DRAFT_9623 [Dichotomopilus funicola]|uniref:Macro domain-containing protein n=1 Tax=Dichotomopilus funicola TaxID=1934379 RepID=A0AAN6V895_9PEZI|nr:hypothetical protein C8A04DRAFT_9623 [Dichotomopilus funicola]